MHTPTSLSRRHRFPTDFISYCLWRYFRFALSYRHVEQIRARRGLTLTFETVRQWCLKFGHTCATGLRRRSPRPGDRWHLAELFSKLNGRVHDLWRAVDEESDVLYILVQRRRDKQAAKKFFRKLLKGLPEVP